MTAIHCILSPAKSTDRVKRSANLRVLCTGENFFTICYSLGIVFVYYSPDIVGSQPLFLQVWCLFIFHCSKASHGNLDHRFFISTYNSTWLESCEERLYLQHARLSPRFVVQLRFVPPKRWICMWELAAGAGVAGGLSEAHPKTFLSL